MKKAFTLIELLAVIVIVAIIATIGVFAVTRIMDNARIESLKDTALAVKKAAKLYASSNELTDNFTVLDMTPGSGSEASLIDLSKDPWGKSYEVVAATITVDNGVNTYDVYLETSKLTYSLTEMEVSNNISVASSTTNPIPEVVMDVINPVVDTPMFTFNGVEQTDITYRDGNNPNPEQFKVLADPQNQKGNVLWLNHAIATSGSYYSNIMLNSASWEPNTTYRFQFDMLLNSVCFTPGCYAAEGSTDDDYEFGLGVQFPGFSYDTTTHYSTLTIGQWKHIDFNYTTDASPTNPVNIAFDNYWHRLYLDNFNIQKL